MIHDFRSSASSVVISVYEITMCRQLALMLMWGLLGRRIGGDGIDFVVRAGGTLSS